MSGVDDLDFSEYDQKTEYTFNETYSSFVRSRGSDTVLVDKTRCIRAVARDMLKSDKPENAAAKEWILNHPKDVEINNLSRKIKDPHSILKLKEKTKVQELADKHIPYLKYYGSFAYSCSCGSGKTIAGIQFIAGLQCRTLIISSRNAVNDQWKVIIAKMYPKLIIETKRKQYRGLKKLSAGDYVEHADIYIDTPQYLARKLDSLTMMPSLIIFDEVHSLLSANFIRVLLFPIVQVMKGDRTELPYLVALSATYPPYASRGYKSLMKMFGKAYRTESTITDIPVYIWDYYDHFRKTVMGKDGKVVEYVGEDARGNWDFKYKPMEDWQAIEYFAEAIDGTNKDINAEIATLEKQVSAIKVDDSVNTDGSVPTLAPTPAPKPVSIPPKSKSKPKLDATTLYNVMTQIKNIDPTDINHKGIIMTYTIDSSAYAAMYCHLRWNVPVLLIRSIDEPDLYITNGPADVFELEPTTTYADIIEANVGTKCNYLQYLDKVPIIVGTFHRLKEGFSVQNITWGICTKFVWSYISRVQLVGRIRRASEDPELNSRTRILMCNTSTRPSNLKVPKRPHQPFKWQYDIDVESAIFEYENYVKI